MRLFCENCSDITEHTFIDEPDLFSPPRINNPPYKCTICGKKRNLKETKLEVEKHREKLQLKEKDLIRVRQALELENEALELITRKNLEIPDISFWKYIHLKYNPTRRFKREVVSEEQKLKLEEIIRKLNNDKRKEEKRIKKI